METDFDIQAIEFDVKDVTHKIAAKFVPAYLPDAKKPYYLKPAHQQELNIHEVASKVNANGVSHHMR